MANNNLSVEIISPVASYFGKFLTYMPNPDLLLEETGETLEIYHKMLLDARISSLLGLRKTTVLNFPFHLKPGDETPKAKEIADFVDSCLERLNCYQEFKELLSALEFGFAVSEVIWELKNGYWISKALKSRKQERFGFRPDGTAVLIVDPVKPLRLLNDPYKFIIHRHSPQAENPYGNSVLKQCYWPWMFKKAGFRFWMTAAEKFGVPTVLAIFETDDEDKARARAQMLTEALSNIQNDAAIALANIKDVDTLEVKGDLADFKVLIDCCNNEISYALTGQSLATAESKYGTKAQAEVHEKMLKKFAMGDAKELAWTLNRTLISWITELNFGKDAPVPILEFELDEYASWEIVKDAMDRGVSVSKQALYTKYNIPEPINMEDAFVSAKGLNLSDDIKKKTFLSRPFLFISSRKT